jgi:hypothetical protein
MKTRRRMSRRIVEAGAVLMIKRFVFVKNNPSRCLLDLPASFAPKPTIIIQNRRSICTKRCLGYMM